MVGKCSSPPRWRGALQCAFFVTLAFLAVQAAERPSAAVHTTKPHREVDLHPLQGSVPHGSNYSLATDVAQSQPQPTPAHKGSAPAATSSLTLQDRNGPELAADTGPRLLQSQDEEDRQTSTQDVETVCFSRNLDGILDPNTGEFIDQGRSAEELLAEMKAKSLAPGREAAMDAFASMVEEGDINSSMIAKFFPLLAVVFLLVAGLIVFLLFCCIGPLVCCPCCRCCCCCVRRRAHSKSGRIPCYLIFGLIVALLSLAMAVAAYRCGRKALNEATAVVCAGGRSVDAAVYGTRTRNGMSETAQGGGLGFAGIKNLVDDTRQLARAADGSNPNNVVNQVKEEILAALNIEQQKKLFQDAKAAATGNIEAAQDVAKKASHINIFVEEQSASLLGKLKIIENHLGNIDTTSPILEAFQDIELPPADLAGFSDADTVVNMVSDMAASFGSASLSLTSIIDTMDFVFLCVSTLSGALVVMAVFTLIWQLFRPNRCARRTVGALAILMTILSVVICVTVAVTFLVHKVVTPVCDYAAVRFIDINADHVFAKYYGEDSAFFQSLSICLSETGSGDLLQEEDGTSRIDPILGRLEEAKQEICEQIPAPPKVDYLDMGNFNDDARLQSWAVVLGNRSAFNTFPQVQASGIQEPDSQVPVRQLQARKTIYGLGTVRELVQPWQVAISDAANPGTLTITSQAPSPANLESWFQECSRNNGTNCEKIKDAVSLLKVKIGLMVSKTTCFLSSTGSQGRPCSVTQLMGGIGGSPVLQNALDNSVADVVDAVKQLKAKVEGSRDIACSIAKNKINSLSDQVLKIKQGSNCKFARDRFIRITNHLCYGTVDGLGSGSFLYFVLAIVMLLFALLLLILIVEDRDNERYPDPRYTPAADGAAEPAGGSSEASVSAPQDDGKETEDSNAIQAHDGDGDIQDEPSKLPQAEAPTDSVNLIHMHRSEGVLAGATPDGIARRLASIP